MKQTLSQPLRTFRLPKYAHLPDVGLYLEQTTQYINRCLAPLGCVEITSSMIRNYVKMGLVNHPVGKQYYADQIAHLIVIAILKHTLSLEHIGALFRLQQDVFSDQVAYDYFCAELENVLFYQFDLKDTVEHIGVTSSREKTMLRSAIIAVSHIIYLNHCFESLEKQ
jgi:DNA-binding transcriptional MerR regulator